MPGKALTSNKSITMKDLYNYYLPYIFLILLLRLVISFIRPYTIDMAGYQAWSDYLADNGPSQLYGTSGYHIVYAPFFQYFLWLTGEFKKLFSLNYAMHGYLIKLWSVLFEFLGAFIIIKFAEKVRKPKTGFIAALFYVLNPGVFINSSIWGQFDSIPATMLIGVLYLFVIKKPNLAALLFLAAVLTKPQSGLLLPVVMFLYFKDFRLDWRSFRRLFLGLASGVVLYLAIVLPFYIPTSKAGMIPGFLDPFYWLIDLYSRSIQDYPYGTANAFNLWFLLGGQIEPDIKAFWGLSYLWWGNILLAAGLIYAFVCLVKGRGGLYSIIYFSFMTLFSAFLFMTKMHERYLLPAIILCTLAVIFDKRHILTAILISVCVFANHLYLYIISFKEQYWLSRFDGVAMLFALITLLAYGLSVFRGYQAFLSPKADTNALRQGEF